MFQQPELLQHFINRAIQHKSISNSKLFECRILAKSWKAYIEKGSNEVARMVACQRNINRILQYDPEVYDQYYYKRIIIKNELIPVFNKYKKLKLPFIDSCLMDMDLDEISESVIIYTLSEISIPQEYSIFLHEYYQNPTVFIKLYKPEFINKVINSIKSNIKSKLEIINNDSSIPGLLYLIPLCYSKHYRSNFKDNQFVNVLCYVSVIDENSEHMFPELFERYIVITVELLDMDAHYNVVQEYLLNITKSIIEEIEPMSDYETHIDLAITMQPIDKCLELLMKHQKFNL